MNDARAFQDEVRHLRPYMYDVFVARCVDPAFLGMSIDEITVTMNLAYLSGDDGRSAKDMFDDLIQGI